MDRAIPAAVLAATLAVAGLMAGVPPAHPQAAEERELVAVLDLEPVGAAPVEAQALTERLREVLLNSGHVTLVDRSQIEAVLDEQALQQTGCTEQECAVQVGRILGVRKLVAGKVVKVSEEVWLLSALMVDVETAETLKVASVQHEGAFLGLMSDRVRELGRKLVLDSPQAAVPAAATGAATRVAPEPSREPLPVAVFAPYLSGQASSLLEPRQRLFTSTIAAALREQVPHAELVYTYGDDPQSWNDADVGEDSWSGFFSKDPNDVFIYRKGRDLDARYVLLFEAEGSQRGRTSSSMTGLFTLYLYDIDRRRRQERSFDWSDLAGLHTSIAREAVAFLRAARSAP